MVDGWASAKRTANFVELNDKIDQQLCSSTTEITQFFQTTLLAVQTNGQVNSTPKAGSGPVSLQSLLDAAVESLVELGLVRGKRKGKSEDGAVRIEITPLGQASFKGNLNDSLIFVCRGEGRLPRFVW